MIHALATLSTLAVLAASVALITDMIRRDWPRIVEALKGETE